MKNIEIDVVKREGLTQAEVKRYCRACGRFGTTLQKEARLICANCAAVLSG